MVGPSCLRQWVTGWLWSPAHGGGRPSCIAPQKGGLRTTHTALPEQSRCRAETWTEQLPLSSRGFLTLFESAVTWSLPSMGAVQSATTEQASRGSGGVQALKKPHVVL